MCLLSPYCLLLNLGTLHLLPGSCCWAKACPKFKGSGTGKKFGLMVAAVVVASVAVAVVVVVCVVVVVVVVAAMVPP